jgi:phospho-N-acetylmuramoyl-pentapeptide-transferase
VTYLNLAAWAAVAAGISALTTSRLIGALRARQLGKVIRDELTSHQGKAGTPTMGGLAILLAVAVTGTAAICLGAWSSGLSGAMTTGLALAVGLLFAALGEVDDFAGLERKGRARERGVGLSARSMLAAQVLIAAVATTAFLMLDPALTFGSAWWALGLTLIGVLAIVGTTNGVNFADGLDGLAAGLLSMAFGTQALLIRMDPYALELGSGFKPAAALAAAASGACLGFLVYNRHPARVFMGNVGSMGLGGLLAALAVASRSSLAFGLLPLYGAVFVVEVLSVISQVAFYKATGGRRLWRMAPIHHHFEKLGWPETRIVKGFWLGGALAAMVSVAVAVAALAA